MGLLNYVTQLSTNPFWSTFVLDKHNISKGRKSQRVDSKDNRLEMLSWMKTRIDRKRQVTQFGGKTIPLDPILMNLLAMLLVCFVMVFMLWGCGIQT